MGTVVLLSISVALTTTEQQQCFPVSVTPSLHMVYQVGCVLTQVVNFMLSHRQRGTGRGSFITARSVHKSRIERLWHDVFFSCAMLYYNIFN